MSKSFTKLTGIYKLLFSSGKYYIGQAQDIDIRYKTHVQDLNRGTHFNFKVLNEFNNSGTPELIVLCTCSIEELDILEPEYIDLYDPKCLNILSGKSNEHRGENSPRAIYSKEQLLPVLEAIIANPSVLRKELSEELGIDIGTINDISAGRGRFLEFIESHKQLCDSILNNKAKNTRGLNTLTLTNGKDTVVLKTGEYSEFCRRNGIFTSNLSKVIKGTRKSTMGWQLLSYV